MRIYSQRINRKQYEYNGQAYSLYSDAEEFIKMIIEKKLRDNVT
mgnify:CR=1 FL=1